MKKKQIQKKFRKIRIVSSNYKITYHDEIKDEKGKPLDGRIIESEKIIMVLKFKNYQRTLQVIMHESVHGLKWELCFNEKHDEDNNILLTTGVTCFMRDNPEFVTEYMRVLNNG